MQGDEQLCMHKPVPASLACNSDQERTIVPSRNRKVRVDVFRCLMTRCRTEVVNISAKFYFFGKETTDKL